VASSSASKGGISEVLVSGAGGPGCNHCKEGMERVALTSDAELGTVNSYSRNDAIDVLQPAGHSRVLEISHIETIS
jgi:hypothetical protein